MDDMVKVQGRDGLHALNSVMEFDHVIRVHADGTVSEPRDVRGPDLYDGELDQMPGDRQWRLMTGYTGQHAYDGPIMHPDEYIGGRMARDIIEHPGLYVALVATSTEPCGEYHEDGTGPSDDEGPCDLHDIDGWAVAYILDPEE